MTFSKPIPTSRQSAQAEWPDQANSESPAYEVDKMMYTLFGGNILSPAPSICAEPEPFNYFNRPAVVASRSPPISPQHLYPPPQPSPDSTLQTLIHDSQISNNISPPVRRKGHPKILFLGHRRSGKSSIQKLIFSKLAPADTLFLEPTNSISTVTVQSFIPLSSTEVPSHIRVPPIDPQNSDIQAIFSGVGAVIWVLDIQDEYQASIQALIHLALYLADNHSSINLEVFIHKTDGLSEEYKYDTFREVRQQFQDEVSDLGYASRINVSYNQTSIFDHSIFEAMSKVVQKLIPQLPAMETLLNKLCSTCGIQKAYLFDTATKIYVATDASPTFLRDYEACSDYVDVLLDLKQIYGSWRRPRRRSSDGSHGAHDDEETLEASTSTTSIGESVITYDKTGDTYLYVREIGETLALLCVMGKGSTPDKKVLIDYNVDIAHDALLQILNIGTN